MAYISFDDIRGYDVNGEVYCFDCGEKKVNPDNLTGNDIITQDTIDGNEGFYFCDACGEQL